MSLGRDSIEGDSNTSTKEVPSNIQSFGRRPPANSVKVGSMSVILRTGVEICCGLMVPGHQAITGILTPPSKWLALPPEIQIS